MNFHERLEVKPSSWKNDRLHFFKYMSFETAKVVLANRTLRWSTPRTLNDVYDVQFDLGLNIDLNKFENLAYEKMWRVASGQIALTNVNAVGGVLREVGKAAAFGSKEEFVKKFEGVVRKGYERMVAKLPEAQGEFRKIWRIRRFSALQKIPQIRPCGHIMLIKILVLLSVYAQFLHLIPHTVWLNQWNILKNCRD